MRNNKIKTIEQIETIKDTSVDETDLDLSLGIDGELSDATVIMVKVPKRSSKCHERKKERKEQKKGYKAL